MTLRQLALSEFTKVGLGIARPEGVVVSGDGRAFASHQGAGVGELLPGGKVRAFGAPAGSPNGLAFDLQGRLLIANFGIFVGEPGPLERLDLATGARTVVVGELEGQPLTSCNVVVVARSGVLYCSHSTFAPTWPEALDGRPDGFVFAVWPGGHVEIVARDLSFPNGVALSADERYLYVTQTSRGDVVRYRVLDDGGLGPREAYGPRLGFIVPFVPNPKWKLPGNLTGILGYTDGIAFDAAGNLWVTLPAAHRIVAITPALQVVTIAHDPSGELIRSPTNVCWGGPELRDLYIGDLDTDYVLKAESPVPGQPTVVQARRIPAR